MIERAGGEAANANGIDQVLGEYLEALDAGRAPARDELLMRHPELAGELAAFFVQQEQFERIVAPLREAALPEEPTEADPEAAVPPWPAGGARPEEDTVPDPGETVAA